MHHYECVQKAKSVCQISNLEILYDVDEQVAEKQGLWITAAKKRGEPEVLSVPSLFWILKDC